MMINNLSRRARMTRVIVGVALIVVAILFSYSMTVVWIVYGVATILVATASVSYCPIYHGGSLIRRVHRRHRSGE